MVTLLVDMRGEGSTTKPLVEAAPMARGPSDRSPTNVLCRGEGGYRRPTLPRGRRLRSPDFAAGTAVMLARLWRGQDGQGPPARHHRRPRPSSRRTGSASTGRSNASRDEMVQIRDWACANGHASPIKPHPTTIHDAHRSQLAPDPHHRAIPPVATIAAQGPAGAPRRRDLPEPVLGSGRCGWEDGLGRDFRCRTCDPRAIGALIAPGHRRPGGAGSLRARPGVFAGQPTGWWAW